MSGARIESINVGRPRLIMINGQPVKTAIYKSPVEGPVHAGPEGLEPDRQADLSVHGGIDKAVYAYSVDDYLWWGEQLGRELTPGEFGENLTVAGIDLASTRIGERWHAGEALLEVSEPRQPCSKLGAKMGDPRFIKRFAKAMRHGAYLRVIEAGPLERGDPIEVIDRPDHDVTIELLGRIVFEDRSLAARALQAPALSPGWREWATELASG